MLPENKHLVVLRTSTDSPLNANNWPLALNGLLFMSFLVVVVFSQIYCYRRVSNSVQRQQIKWAVFGLILYAVLLIGLSLFAFIPGLYQPGSPFSWLASHSFL